MAWDILIYEDFGVYFYSVVSPEVYEGTRARLGEHGKEILAERRGVSKDLDSLGKGLSELIAQKNSDATVDLAVGLENVLK